MTINNKCQFCNLSFDDVSTGLGHLQALHGEQCRSIFQRIDTKAKLDPEYEIMPYKDYIAKLWAEFVPDDDWGY